MLGADHVDEALFAGLEVDVGDTDVVAVGAQGGHHFRGERIARLVLVFGRHDVIDRSESALREFHLQPEVAEHPDITKLAREIKKDRAAWQAMGAAISKKKDRLIQKMKDKLPHGEDGHITYVTRDFKLEVKPGKEGVSIVDLAEEEANEAA